MKLAELIGALEEQRKIHGPAFEVVFELNKSNFDEQTSDGEEFVYFSIDFVTADNINIILS